MTGVYVVVMGYGGAESRTEASYRSRATDFAAADREALLWCFEQWNRQGNVGAWAAIVFEGALPVKQLEELAATNGGFIAGDGRLARDEILQWWTAEEFMHQGVPDNSPKGYVERISRDYQRELAKFRAGDPNSGKAQR